MVFQNRPILWHHHDQSILISATSNSIADSVGSFSGRRRGLRALAFGLVLLGGCVFAWGLRYKLSLYDPPHTMARRMPEAKLLSGRDRTTLVAVHPQQIPSSSGPLTFGALLLAFAGLLAAGIRPGSAGSRLIPVGARRAPQFARRTAVFIRPPPSLR